MRNLFADDQRQLEELLAQLKKPSPEFSTWVRALLKRKDGINTLEDILGVVIKKGLAPDRLSALEYINELTLCNSPDRVTIACSDILGKKHNRPFALLKQLLTKQKLEAKDIFNYYGIISHQVVNDVFSGRIPSYVIAQKTGGSESNPSSQVHQNLFDDNPKHSQQLFLDMNCNVLGDFSSGILPNGKISDQLKEELVQLRREAGTKLKNLSLAKDWPIAYDTIAHLVPGLRSRLLPIFGSYVYVLERDPSSYVDYLSALSMFSWLSILLNGPRKNKILFREIPVMAADIGFNAGRIDALEVTHINGKTPSRLQRKILQGLSNSRFSSSGHLIASLEQKLGGKPTLKIIDWKFAVGDGLSNGGILRRSDIQKLPLKHITQLKRYITLVNLDYWLIKDPGKIQETTRNGVWPRDPVIKNGQLVYVLPFSRPIVHETEMAPDEQETYFRSIASRFSHIEKLAEIRNLNNAVLGPLVNKTGKNGHSYITGKKSKQKYGHNQISLIDGPPERKKILFSLIDNYRQFADQTRIIECVDNIKNDGTERVLFLHLDSLQKAMETGVVQGRFNTENGKGYISCLMPEHEDSTPSMHLDLKRGVWKCFGCGVCGFFAGKSSFGGSGISVKTARIIPHDFKHAQKFAIPDEHHRIMLAAQQILNHGYKKSEAETYTTSRHIDPDLAHGLGAGFAENNFMNEILDAYDYDKLIKYGFIGISSKISSRTGLCPLLSRRGMKLDQMKRRVDDRKDSFGLPYSALGNRITFPLVMEGRYTNFYGRATWPDCTSRNRHRKLSTAHTDVPHGGFNSSILQSDIEEIIIAEGVFDALSLIQFGHQSTMAIIGISNYAMIESIGRSGKNLALALDYDKNQTGQNSTEKIIGYLKKNNSNLVLRDFTKDFITKHPDFLTCGKDYNEYLINKTKTA